MTEQEALNKWCPFSSVDLNQAAIHIPVNRKVMGGIIPEGTNCLGSGCAVWRKKKTGLSDEPRGECGLTRE